MARAKLRKARRRWHRSQRREGPCNGDRSSAGGGFARETEPSRRRAVGTAASLRKYPTRCSGPAMARLTDEAGLMAGLQGFTRNISRIPSSIECSWVWGPLKGAGREPVSRETPPAYRAASSAVGFGSAQGRRVGSRFHVKPEHASGRSQRPDKPECSVDSDNRSVGGGTPWQRSLSPSDGRIEACE